MALKGKSVVVNVSPDDVTYSPVLELNDVSFTIDGNNIDVTEFGEDFMSRIQGLKDGSWSMSGFYAPSDTTGQVAIRDALINDTTLYAQTLFDGTNGFQQNVKVSSFDISASVDGAVEVSMDFEGNGPVTQVP